MEYKTVENEKLYLDINNFINAEFFEEPRGTYNTKASYACEVDVNSFVDRRLTGKSFSDTLLTFIQSRQTTDSAVYSAAKLDRRHYFRLLSNSEIRPTKQTVMALGLALELSKPEFSTLLQSAGYSLSRSLKQDVIVEYFILNRIYDIDLIDDALYSFGEKTICRA